LDSRLGLHAGGFAGENGSLRRPVYTGMTVHSDGDTIYRMEGVITAIHGDVVEIEFNRGFPNIKDSLIVQLSSLIGGLVLHG
jgi:hypothetical protein